MRAAKRRPPRAISGTTQVLLRELREECENVIRLIQRLEQDSMSEAARDEIFGELSAAVLHLHTHTEGLDEFLCETA